MPGPIQIDGESELLSHSAISKKFWVRIPCVSTVLHWMQGGLVARKVSVCLSICLSIHLSNTKNLSRFLYHMKDHLD